jgi:Holliday junction resolvase RusA-like endonuclease
VRPDARRRDLDNFVFKVVFDLLVSLDVVSDDSQCAEPSPRWITAGDGVTVRVETIS